MIAPQPALPARTMATAPPPHQVDWTAVVDELQPRLLRTAVAILGDVHGAEDAVQEALLRAWSGVHALRDPVALVAWLGSIVRHTAIDHLRRRARDADRTVGSFDESLHAPHARSARALRPETTVEVADEIRALAPALRSVVVAHLRGDDLAGIAASEGISYSAARTRLSRARRALRGRAHHGCPPDGAPPQGAARLPHSVAPKP